MVLYHTLVMLIILWVVMMSRPNRQKGNSSRKTKSRYSGDTVLIICEGTQTEPNYLNELKDYFALNQASIDIVPSDGSAPNSVVKHAKQAIKDACAKGNPYAKVYCVIDKDLHPTYTSALQDIVTYNSVSRVKCDTVICAIPSVPCFEYWILMHFTPSTQNFGTSGSSPCGQLISTALKTHIPGYTKANRVLARELISTRLEIARKNSAITLNLAQSANTDDPSTKIHLLVDELEYLKNNTYFKDDKKGCPQ
ncbi:MAG: RloB domain-containing protein [Epsilonproteobacteria bacterium]|nr:MAG: RloB domain-containing protein [Campylobacterota bacterium]